MAPERETPDTPAIVDVDDALLRDWALPMPPHDGDKEGRGRTIVVAGSTEMPGAAWLAGIAALRAGAGKLTLAVPASVAPGLALLMPEARVVTLADPVHETDAAHPLTELLSRCQALLIGPGMQGEDAVCRACEHWLGAEGDYAVILDASAMGAVTGPRREGRPVLVTPHAGEMAHLTGLSKDEIKADRERTAREAARRWNAVVALKGATTVIAAPDGRTWRHDGGNAGLATSGSGDTLAGIIAGLAARGAPLEQAAVWGVALHARAGSELAKQQGPLGYLAREVPGEIPRLMHRLGGATDPG
ncbi:NAD(P)H-hydrate dehydratase [Piscinibacter koreensis]|uniref:ADP-dependent (S)-NAD(P)H-hydrate dehydratase n=1 Tax=Piscinibacter koreensis TaxID=2742824 RepID=A0A7Y6NM11_9BURK|nr:NAD(P)H-hydrate dehydratase [Schlegelella koreensis]NUZ05572.1 NAD(P)H-hydrate dehydratase [Schlegelella koreensis]